MDHQLFRTIPEGRTGTALTIAPSTWHEHAHRKADPGLRSTRAKEDEWPSEEVVRVHAKNFGVYGAKKV